MQLYVPGLYHALIEMLAAGRAAEAEEILVQLRAWEKDALVLGPDLAQLLLELDSPMKKRPDFRGS